MGGGFTRCSSVCPFVRMSSVKFVKSFARWKHLAAGGGLSYRLRYLLCGCCSRHWSAQRAGDAQLGFARFGATYDYQTFSVARAVVHAQSKHTVSGQISHPSIIYFKRESKHKKDKSMKKNMQCRARCKGTRTHVGLLGRLHVAYKNNTKIEMIYNVWFTINSKTHIHINV